ncbi:GAP45 [Babesia caballi]|uniref:GAP45 n=1 Tax=Babesia caballi TaxID=5871 RepID=A0AAV4LSM3_BABCB|nr:GAP45 [Babesia caballi]
MPICCSKKAAQRQKEYEEEVRMRKLEEAARVEQEQRAREEARKAEIERIMQEEKQADMMKKLAEEERAEKERLAHEQELEEQRRAEEERLRLEEEQRAAENQPIERMGTRKFTACGPVSLLAGSSHHSVDASAAVGVAAGVAAGVAVDAERSSKGDESFEMQTYTPFDMSTVDQTARYMATKCGCALKAEHKPQDCTICQGIDLSDAPLIA